MSAQVARPIAADAILDAFGLQLGGTTSGVAHGGHFVTAGGPPLETVDPSTGTVLARVATATEADYEAVSRSARTE